jgi:hypothetical protein
MPKAARSSAAEMERGPLWTRPRSGLALDGCRTQRYMSAMTDAEGTARAFKTAWFTKAARKARIKDDELCEAIEDVRKGQADDLGGGVFKKRLNKNMHRSIILAKGGRYWIYQFLFAKKDQANIDDDYLDDFRTLAKKYAALSEKQIARLLEDKDLTEICNGDEKQV